MRLLGSIQRIICRLAIVFGLLAHQSATAQKIENVRTSFDQSKQLMLIYYDLKGLNYKKEVNIIPYIVVGDTSILPIHSLTGDVGWVSRGGKNKLIIWDPFKDGVNSLEGIEVRIKSEMLEVRKAAIPRYRVVALHGSNSAPFGLRYMQLSQVGFFVGFRTGRFPPAQLSDPVSNEGVIDPYYGVYEIGDEERLTGYAFTAGPIFQVARNVYTYTGMGYGTEQLFWEYQRYDFNKSPTSSEWVVNENINYKGIATDAGIIVRLGRLVLDLGGSAIQFKSFQITGGVGLAFTNNKKR